MQTAWQLNPAHSGTFIRLRTLLEKLQGFHTIIAQHNNPAYRDGLIEQLTAANADTRILDLKTIGNFNAFEAALSQFETGTAPLQVINLESLDSARRDEFFRGLNYHREHIARQLKTSLVLWMVEPHIRDMALQAPDFWAWREKVFEFSLTVETQVRWEGDWQKTTGLDREKKQQRIQEVLDYLKPLEDEEATISMADMLHELGNLYLHLGEYSLAKQSLEQAHHHFIALDEKHAAARVLMDLAYLQSAQGEPAEALALLLDKVLPCFKELNDLKQQAEVQGRIADILQARGDLEEALNALQNDVLPIFEKLGDVQAKAVTMGKIADILQTRGQLDEALNIRQNDQLPVYEKLGDVQAKAVTMGKIADILQTRGQLDEALSIRQNEELPIFEKLGDVQAKAVTMGKIADILKARGQLDEALNIRQNDQIPVYEKLGDVRAKAVTMGKIADTLWQQDPTKHAETIRDYLNEALGHFQTMQLPGETKWIERLFIKTGLPHQAPADQTQPLTPPTDKQSPL